MHVEDANLILSIERQMLYGNISVSEIGYDAYSLELVVRIISDPICPHLSFKSHCGN